MRVQTAARDSIEAFLDPGYLDLDQVLSALEFEVAQEAGLFSSGEPRLRRCSGRERKLAITISGGGASGAYSAGLLEVLLARLQERGVPVGLIVGTSSGAMNGYGAFLEYLGMANPQFRTDPSVQQPYRSLIASIWSYLARDGRASRWIAGHRSWIIRLASRGLPAGWGRPLVPLAIVGASFVLHLAWLLLLLAGLDPAGAQESVLPRPETLGDVLSAAAALALFQSLLLGGLLWIAARTFRDSLFRDVPLLRLLANAGPDGDLRRRSRMPRSLALDRARVLGRDVVSAWYERRDELPEFIATATDITAGRECLFTLVAPDTYRKLVRREWNAVQFDSDTRGEQGHDLAPGAQLARPQQLLQAILASSAVPGAFPTQPIDIYRSDSERVDRHCFVDGGVLNNSPIHIAIDAGATHVISLEILPFGHSERRCEEGRETGGRGLLQTAITTFTTVLERATTEDIRRTASWNRFLLSRPGALARGRSGHGLGGRDRRIVPLYRVVPRERLVSTVEFDGRFENGRPATTLRDILRQGVLDMQGRNIWAATIRHEPGWEDPHEPAGPTRGCPAG